MFQYDLPMDPPYQELTVWHLYPEINKAFDYLDVETLGLEDYQVYDLYLKACKLNRTTPYVR